MQACLFVEPYHFFLTRSPGHMTFPSDYGRELVSPSSSQNNVRLLAEFKWPVSPSFEGFVLH